MNGFNLNRAAANGGALDGHRHRVIVSTDIGGTDPDDFQSMVHLLLYSDCLDIEGLISSPCAQGRKKDILTVIDCYGKDYLNLKTFSEKYPHPDVLRALTKQGEIESAPYAGFRTGSEGSEWIVHCARRDDPRPLYILGWGGIEDIAQALHDAPDILPKLRVHWVGGPNKKWSPDAYQYIAENYPDLWIIESNATYRGWFTGGDQDGEWDNSVFVKQHIAGKGALGEFFNSLLNGTIKMGDTPTVGWVLKGMPEDPTQPGWGGQFVHAWDRPFVCLDRLPSEEDQMEVFGILELALPLNEHAAKDVTAHLMVENQSLPGSIAEDGAIHFRFCPKAAIVFQFTIQSNLPVLNGQTGAITALNPKPEIMEKPGTRFRNWWTDNPAPEFSEQGHHGIKTVNRWRRDYLSDFARRIARCRP